MGDYQVKGSTVQSKFDYVEANFGERAKERMIETFNKKYPDSLFPILNNLWYAFELYVETLEYIADVHYDGEMSKLEAVGASSAKAALSTIYRSFMHSQDYLRFLKRISQLHHMFYNKGKMEIKIHDNKHGCEIIHTEKPRFAEPDLYVASGFYQETARLHKLLNVQCQYRLISEGVAFTLTWD